jgi:hypothetical protein
MSPTFAEAKARRFTAAGFKDVKLHRIGPWWYSGVRRHGLIMGCSVTGRKAAVGESPLKLGPKSEDVAKPAVSRAARLKKKHLSKRLRKMLAGRQQKSACD